MTEKRYTIRAKMISEKPEPKIYSRLLKTTEDWKAFFKYLQSPRAKKWDRIVVEINSYLFIK